MVYFTPKIKWLVALIYLLLFIWVRGLNIFYAEVEPIRPNPIVADIRDYAAVMVSADHPEDFQDDLLYGNGIRREIYGTYSWFYMLGFRFFAGDDLERGLLWYNLFAQFLYLIGMFGLIYAVLEGEPLWAGLLSIISLMGSGFLGSGTQWGIGYDLVVPTTLFTALTPYLLWWAYLRWFKNPHPKPVEIVLMGVALGVMLTRINLVNGLALAEILLGLGFLLAIDSKLPWRSLIAFGTGFALTFILLYQIFAPASQLSDVSYSWEGAQAIINVGEANMVFPWGLGRVQWLTNQHGKEILAGAIFAYTLGTILSLFIYWRSQNKNSAYAFVLLQGFGMLLLMNAGWLPLLAVIYGIWRVKLGKITLTEHWLALFLAIALPLGAVQQIMAYYLWQAAELVPLTGLLFELMRFSHFAYVPLYLILGLFAFEMSNSFDDRIWKGLIWINFAGLIWLNQNQVPFGLFTAGEIGVILFLALLYLPIPILTPASEWFYSLLKMGLATLGLGILIFTISPNDPSSRYTLSPDYLEAAQWAKENTPSDSLFLLTNLDGSWRYYAERPILTAREEWIYAMYIGLDPLFLKDIETQIRLGDPQILVNLAAQTGTDYIVLADSLPLRTDAPPVFENKSYTIYAVENLNPDQSPLQDYPDLFAEYQKHELTLQIPPEATIFNPATGSVAESQAVIQQVAEFAPDLDLLVLLHRMKLEVTLDLSTAQRESLADWRDSKAASDLKASGVDYLLVGSDWLFLLDEAAYAKINAYPLIQSWQVGGQTFFLFQVL